MPEIVGRLRSPRLASAPASPAQGEMYFDTATSKLYWWSGTAWVDATGGGGGGGSAVEYALATGGGAVTACPSITWTLLPVGAVTKSADADTCYRVNADGSISILATGWYTITNQVGVSGAFPASIGVQVAVWYSATDVTPSPVVGASIARQEFASTSAGVVFSSEAITVQLPAGSRIGSGVFQRDTVSRNFISDRFGITRTASGPAGPTGSPANIPVVTVLPSTPATGDEVYFDTGQNVAGLWHLRYNAGISDAYKWYVIGAAPLFNEVIASESQGTTTFADLTTVGPSVTCPLAGIYRILGATLTSTPAILNGGGVAAVKIGAAATSDNDRLNYLNTTAASAHTAAVCGGPMERTVAAGTVLKMQYRCLTANAATWALRRLEAVPYRVG